MRDVLLGGLLLEGRIGDVPGGGGPDRRLHRVQSDQRQPGLFGLHRAQVHH